ncbi:MAG TPA: tyrosine-type recombinase/integrase [Anaerolineae bacterium]
MRLSEALDRFLAAMDGVRSPATLEWYSQRLGALLDVLGDVDVSTIAENDLNRWRASQNGRLSVWTLHGYVRAVRRFFAWLTDKGIVDSNPARDFKLPRLPKRPRVGVSCDVRDRIIEAARSNPRDYALVRFIDDTMCRVGGVVGLRVCDLVLDAGEALVTEKGEKTRKVYLLDEAVAALRAWLEILRPASPTDFVFVGKRGPLTTWGVYQVLERLARRAGVGGRGWNPHNWRHAGAREFLENDGSLGMLSQILGHSDIKVTNDFYGTFADPELKRAHRAHRRRDTPKDS